MTTSTELQYPTQVARHITTNHLNRVLLEIPGVGVELEDTERRPVYVTWAA